MKRLPKIFLIFFLSVFILQMVCLIFLLTIPEKTQAADDVKFNPQVSIPDSKFQRVECPQGMSEEDCEKLKYTITGKTIGEYIQAIYNYAIGIVGILAAVVLMFGGVIWLTAGGSQEKVKEAKAWIGASISGLVLLLCSYMILNTINPDLVSFKEISPKTVSEYRGTVVDDGVCCEYTDADGKINSTRVSPAICVSQYEGTSYPDKIEEPGSGCLTSAEKDLKINERRNELIDAPCETYRFPNQCNTYGAGRCRWESDYYDMQDHGKCLTVYKWEQTNDCSNLGKGVINYGDSYCVIAKPGDGYKCCGKYDD
jgi:hypothetical protein